MHWKKNLQKWLFQKSKKKKYKNNGEIVFDLMYPLNKLLWVNSVARPTLISLQVDL